MRVLKAIERSIEAQGLIIMILLRITMGMPWNTLNYLLSVTDCKLSHFFWGTVIGINPKMISSIIISLNLESLADFINGKIEYKWYQIPTLILGIVVCILIIYIISLESKKKIQEIINAEANS